RRRCLEDRTKFLFAALCQDPPRSLLSSIHGEVAALISENCERAAVSRLRASPSSVPAKRPAAALLPARICDSRARGPISPRLSFRHDCWRARAPPHLAPQSLNLLLTIGHCPAIQRSWQTHSIPHSRMRGPLFRRVRAVCFWKLPACPARRWDGKGLAPQAS